MREDAAGGAAAPSGRAVGEAGRTACCGMVPTCQTFVLTAESEVIRIVPKTSQRRRRQHER
jgi:hypothetical protein